MSISSKRTVFYLLALVLFCSSAFAAEKIKVVATTSTFASIVEEITGERAEVYFVASPKRDIHFIAPTPKDVLKLRRADVFVHGGLDLETWRGPLVDAAGRREFLSDGEKVIDVSRGIELLEVPAVLTRSAGDVHQFGNPHYWLDPANGKIIADNIAAGLARAYPEDAGLFMANAESFKKKLDEKMRVWDEKMRPFKDESIVTYHNSWPYFVKRFGLIMAGNIEPLPGIPPTAKHISELTRIMEEKKVKVIVCDSYHEKRTPRKLAEKTGAAVLTFSQAVGDHDEARDYLSMFDYNLSVLKKAFRGEK